MNSRFLKPRVAPVDERTGLIRWILDLPIEPGEPRIFNASVKMADTFRYTSVPCYDNNGGAGLTREAARGAAIGEALERYCSTVYSCDDLIFGTVRDLSPRYPTCLPDQFALFHPDQKIEYSHFTEDTPVAWSWGYSLLRGEPTLVPACLVYMPYVPCFREHGEEIIAPAVSTGMACARSAEEALLRGIYEAVERDAFTITWENGLPMPQVEIESCSVLHEVYCDRLRRDGLDYVLVDITTDILIPSFLCILIDERRSPPMICVGGASSLNPTQAALKALIEAAQTREWAKFLGRSDRKFSFAADFSNIRSFEDHVALYAFGDMLSAVKFLIAGQNAGTLDSWQNSATGVADTDLEKALALLDKHNLDVIAFDLTTPDVRECGYYVTKVIVPQLQPLYADQLQPFLGGVRLYQVPRRLGFTTSDTTLTQLNPYPHPFP